MVYGAGPQAAALVEAAGLPSEQTLSQLWAAGRHELPDGHLGLIRLLGVQSLLVGPQRIASVLLMRTTPSFILSPEQVRLLWTACFPSCKENLHTEQRRVVRLASCALLRETDVGSNR